MVLKLSLIVFFLIVCHLSFSLCIQISKLLHEKKSIADFYINSYNENNSDVKTKTKITFPNNRESAKDVYRPNNNQFNFFTSSKYNKHDLKSLNELKFNNFNTIATIKKAMINNSDPISRANIIEALENISRYDDLQCVARLICDFMSEQKSKSEFSNLLLSPLFKNIIYNLPESSPILLYGKAALLGISNDDIQCLAEYPQCPGNRDDLLYYLNNHRGGLFKFFNSDQYAVEEGEGRNEGGEEASVTNLDFTNFSHIMTLIKYMFIEFFKDSPETNKKNPYSNKIAHQATRYGKIVNKRKNNYYTTESQTTWRPYNSLQHHNYNRPIINQQQQYQLTTSNPNVYVTNSRGEIEYYINRHGQKIYVK